MAFWISLLLAVAGTQEPLRVPSDVAAPTRKRATDPVYPHGARSAWIQGIVTLDATIGRDGKVTEVKVLRSIPSLDPAAIDAVRQWEYEPVVVRGEAVPVVMTVALSFSLPGAEEWVVAPEGEAQLRLEDFFVSLAADGGRTYAGTIQNLARDPLSGLEAIVSYRLDPPPKAGSLDGVEPPNRARNVAPVYPEIARGRVQGRVVLQADVDERGIVGNIRVLRSIPALDPAAIDAVRQWEYEPARRDGIPVPFFSMIVMDFSDENIDVEEGIGAELGRAVVERLPEIEPGGAREFSLTLPSPGGDTRYVDVQLRFVRDEAGQRRDIPTARQRKTISAR